jgi:hypothetical protein
MGVIFDALKYVMGRGCLSDSVASTDTCAEAGRDIEMGKASRGRRADWRMARTNCAQACGVRQLAAAVERPAPTKLRALATSVMNKPQPTKPQKPPGRSTVHFQDTSASRPS